MDARLLFLKVFNSLKYNFCICCEGKFQLHYFVCRHRVFPTMFSEKSFFPQRMVLATLSRNRIPHVWEYFPFTSTDICISITPILPVCGKFWNEDSAPTENLFKSTESFQVSYHLHAGNDSTPSHWSISSSVTRGEADLVTCTTLSEYVKACQLGEIF